MSNIYNENMIIQKLKAALLFLLGLFRRSLCCFRRRRKMSTDVVPLTGVGVVPSSQTQNDSKADDLTNWNSWDDPGQAKAPQTVQEHIQLYRSQLGGQQQPDVQPEQPQMDFFQDMEPHIKKPPKVVLRPKESSQLNRLAFNPSTESILPDDSGELKSWEETENREGLWADSNDWNTKEILKATRKEEKRRKSEKEHIKRGTVT